MEKYYNYLIDVTFEVHSSKPSLDSIELSTLVKAMRDRADSIEASQNREAFGEVDCSDM